MAISGLRLADAYWQELQQLKARVICARLYRNQLGRRVRAVELVRAVASSGAIGGWVIWHDYPLVWASIIAAAQVLDATKGVFAFNKLHRGAADLAVAMEVIWIDAETEWAAIYAGDVAEQDIPKRLAKLRKLQLDTESKNFPEGFEPSAALIRLAAQEANAYFDLVEVADDD